jgi:hypothetical protein
MRRGRTVDDVTMCYVYDRGRNVTSRRVAGFGFRNRSAIGRERSRLRELSTKEADLCVICSR